LRKRKYSRVRPDVDFILAGAPEGVDRSMMTAAYSSATWGRLASSYHSMQKFAQHTGIQVTWPFSQSILHRYIAWAFDTAELSSTTIKAYVHDFSIIHKLRGLDNSNCTSFLTLTALKGAENMELYKNITKKCKSTMDLDLLKKLGHRLQNVPCRNMISRFTGWPVPSRSGGASAWASSSKKQKMSYP